jgi:hypothetical protein
VDEKKCVVVFIFNIRSLRMLAKRIVLVVLVIAALYGSTFSSVRAQPNNEVSKSPARTNYCGIPLVAGNLYNGTSSGILVEGNRQGQGDTVYSVWVQPFHSASDYGICDADHFYVPAAMSVLYWGNNGLITPYYPGNKVKIGAGGKWCSNESLLVIKCNY